MFVLELAVAFFAATGFVGADYYWKDFYGAIPKDAFPGGTDSGGNPTYMGQTYFPELNLILPTVIEKGSREAACSRANKKLSSSKNTKILCSDNPSLFKWIPTSTKKMRYLTGCPQIETGLDSGAIVNIGRASMLGYTVTGGLYDDVVHKWNGLWIHDRNYKPVYVDVFEILTYNCSNPYLEVV